MKPRIRPISNLYFRWGRRLKLDAESVARALELSGFIDRIGRDKYREREGPEVPVDEFEAMIEDVLTRFKANQKEI